MPLSPVAQDLAWLCLVAPGLVGSIQNFATFLDCSPAQLVDAMRDLTVLGCLSVHRDVTLSVVMLNTVSETARQTLMASAAGGDGHPSVPRRRHAFGYSVDLIGCDPAMLEVYSAVDRVSQTNATVLLLGESGVGKEVVARTIHAQSRRSARPFVIVDCAAIPSSLMESELFGHERGSFTSAITTRVGQFEEADGGTVFLDEIGELPLDMQAKLLRVLQTKQFTRIGRASPVTVDVRFIAATNVDLRQRVPTQVFRKDLYYRLNVVTIFIPPLRERRGDIPLLAYRLLTVLSQRSDGPRRRLTPEAMSCLTAYDWPGNVRELENVLERALLLTEGPAITASDLALPGPAASDAVPSSAFKTLREVEIEHIRRVLASTGGNENQAAKILGVHRDTLYRKLRRYKIVSERMS